MTNKNLPKLKDIVDGMEWQDDEACSYLHKKTGEIITVTDEEHRAAEDNESLDKYPEWQQENIKIASEILSSPDDYLLLPSKFDIHEYRIMERFCLSLDDDEMREKMCYCIGGSGAFGRFKDAIHRYDLADQWYSYRDNALKKIAVEWCGDNDVEFIED